MQFFEPIHRVDHLHYLQRLAWGKISSLFVESILDIKKGSKYCQQVYNVLTHFIFVTDISDREFILGRLFLAILIFASKVRSLDMLYLIN
jgi:hypothetical protein